MRWTFRCLLVQRWWTEKGRTSTDEYFEAKYNFTTRFRPTFFPFSFLKTISVEFISLSKEIVWIKHDMSALVEVYLIEIKQPQKWKCSFFLKVVLQFFIHFTPIRFIHKMSHRRKHIHENRVNYLNRWSCVWFISPDTLTTSESGNVSF